MLPLSGIRVVEWSTAVAGPYGGMILADLGADVIKVERPGDERGRGGGTFISGNRNKRSIAVDLSNEEGVEIMRRLMVSADILLENFAPGAIEKLGLGYDVVYKLNPKLIFVSLKGYLEGPYGMMPAMDPVIEAASGIMSMQGERGRGPVRYGGALIDQTTAMYCIVAALAALANRDKTGKGDYIRVGMFEDAVSIVQHYLALYSLYGVVLDRMGSGVGASQCFKTTDGWVYIDASSDEAWRRFCEAFGIYEEKLRFATAKDRSGHLEEVERVMAEALSKASMSEAVKMLKAANVVVAPVNTSKEVAEDPHLKATKSLIYIAPDSRTPNKTVTCVKIPIRTNDHNPSMKGWEGIVTPRLGEHTIDILRELGYTDDKVIDLRRRKIVWPYLEEVK